MSLLFKVLFANECTSTHHKLALDALRHLEDEDAAQWRNLFLYYFDAYLDGSKAPDKKFKDFRNHVLHVHDNYWGGACKKANEWYVLTVRHLKSGAWSKAAYSAGVLSHYFTDPFMPFHSGQSEEETQIHRAVEWSIAKSYDELQNILEEQGGYPDIGPVEGEDWLAEMIRGGAEIGNAHYQMIIDHYDLKAGVKDPPAGLDQEIKDAIAEQLGLASVGFARVLENAFDDADVEPPKVSVTLAGYLATLTIPIAWVTRKISDARERKTVQAMYRELQAHGRVDRTMPADDREARRLHAEEVLNISVEELTSRPLGPIGAEHGHGKPVRKVATKPVVRISREECELPAADAAQENAGASTKPPRRPRATGPRFYLRPTDDVVDSPSIGPKTAKRLENASIDTVADLLSCDPDETAAQLKVRYIDAELIQEWQAQARLVCCIPNLRGHDAQILVACGVMDSDQLGTANLDELLELAREFAISSEGKRVLRSSAVPDREEVEDWIEWASQSRQLPRAA
jgi:predicted flap endonuclease-1-like 5' DNA nuclease